MSGELKHECGVAMVVLRRAPASPGDFGGTKLSLLLEKQHNRGQDGAGAAILRANPEPGTPPYWMAKSASATPLADVLCAIGRRRLPNARIFLGHLRYATYGKGDETFCHPFVHGASDLAHTLLLAGNFNLTNAGELFGEYSRAGAFPTSRSDGYLICELIARGLLCEGCAGKDDPPNPVSAPTRRNLLAGLRSALSRADGAWTLCGMTGDGWAFATRDPHGIRPGWYYADEEVVAVASERPAIQAAFDVPPEAVRELPPPPARNVSPAGRVEMAELCPAGPLRPCSFERIYFSRANDADIHRERKALGAALLPQILKAADADISDIFFSYIPNSAQVAFHGLLEELFRAKAFPRFGQIAVKDAKFRTFIADAHSRDEFYKHVYDVTYGLVRPGRDTLVVLDDSIVRGNTMRNAILPMLDRLGPRRIVVVSSAPPIRYPDCYGIDMSTLGELVAFRALVNLLGDCAGAELRAAPGNASRDDGPNPLAPLYARFTDEAHCAEIARLLTPPGMKAEVRVVFQTVENLRKCLQPRPLRPFNPSTAPDCGGASIGDWYFTGDYPTTGGYKVLRKALLNYLGHNGERPY
ncbi:MAG: amidophosphoribosyltransferase [Kiritimatiellae bacterium]|nr:amidophosphoribosyltransferase [Kiritimatiellia bacterium]